jgi:hypothetical protein
MDLDRVVYMYDCGPTEQKRVESCETDQELRQGEGRTYASKITR